MKTQILIQTFAKEELTLIEKELADKANGRLMKIFACLKNKEGVNKEELFQLAFEEKYTTKKDYLLRNEIRLLNQFLENYIVKKEVLRQGNEWVQQKILLQYYLDHKQPKLFEETWNACFKKINISEQLQQYFDLLTLQVLYVSTFLEVTEEHYQPLFDLLHQSTFLIDNLSLEYQYQFAKYYYFSHRILYSLTQKDIPITPSLISFQDNIETLLDTTQVKYFQAKQYQTDLAFEEKVALLDKLLLLLKDNPLARLAVYNNLGVEYFIRSDFRKAYTNYAANYKLIKENKVPLDSRVLSTFQNYISAAISVGEYQAAISVYNENEAALAATLHNFHNVQRMIAIAYLFLKDTTNAFKFMPHNINERGKNEYYYYRAVYALGYLLNKEFDLASRETENAYRALKATPFEQGEFEKLFLAIKHLIDYQLGKTTKKQIILNYLDQETHIGFHLKELIKSILD